MDYTYLIHYLPFLLIVLLVAFILIRAHTSAPNITPFSIFDLIQDGTTKKGSLEKVGVLIGILSVTLWFTELTAVGKATWEDAVAFGGLLGLAKVARDVITLKSASTPVVRPTTTLPADQ